MKADRSTREVGSLNDHAKQSTASPGDFPFRLIFEHMADAALLLDAAGVVVHANVAARAAYRLPAEQLVGRRLIELCDVTSFPCQQTQFDAILAGRSAWRGTLNIAEPAGTLIKLDTQLTPLDTANGPLWLCLQREQAGNHVGEIGANNRQPVLRENTAAHFAAKNRALLAAIPDLIVHLTRDCKLVAHSARHNGHAIPADADFLEQFVSPEVRALTQQAVHDALATGAMQRFECTRQFGGQRRAYEVRVVPFQQDEALAIVRDITEHRLAEEVLRSNEAKLRGIIDAMNVYVALIAPDGLLLEVSQLPLTISGLAREDVVGVHFWRTSWFEDYPALRQDIEQNIRIAAAGQETRFDMVARIANRESIHVDTSLRPLFDEQGQVELIVATGLNITERVQAYEEVHRLHEKLAHVLRVATVDEMAASIAHELNQPLTAIQNYSHTLKTIVERALESPDPRISAIANNIGQQVQHASAIIRGLRDFVRKGASRKAPQDLNEVIRRTVTLLEPDSKLLGITLEAVYNESLPTVYVDAVQIQQVVLNLVRNAIESIAAGSTTHRTIRIDTAQLTAEQALVSVADTGPGIDRAARESIFNAFYTTKPSGLGMGLALSRSIVEAHGGRLWAESIPGQETIFHLTLPFDGDEARRPCLTD